ncbi:MAG: NAD(+)/NADH kinase [Actinomycetota bacterium]
MRRVGIVVHAGRPAALQAAAMIVSWLGEHDVATRCVKGEFEGADEAVESEELANGVDVVVSVGGDGTLLRAAHLASPAGVPLLGVKVGRLGFLTEVEPPDAVAVLERALRGHMAIDERMALVARPVDAPWAEPQWALNEIIVEKRARHRLITLRALVGGEYVTTFSADGVIVATPTGSTAYSFSARGPIVSPRVPCLLLTPVSPHMVFDRSVVLSPEEGVTLEVTGEEPGLLSADGRPGLELPVGSTVRIERSDQPARLLRRPDSPTFFALLREKFSLPGDATRKSAHPTGDVGPGG